MFSDHHKMENSLEERRLERQRMKWFHLFYIHAKNPDNQGYSLAPQEPYMYRPGDVRLRSEIIRQKKSVIGEQTCGSEKCKEDKMKTEEANAKSEDMR